MNKIRHGVGALILVGIMIGLFYTGYTELGAYYGIVEGGDQYSATTNETNNIMGQLSNIKLIQEMDKITNNVLKIGSPDATSFDIVGGLAALGIGVLQTIVGIAVFPFQILNILAEYYIGIPPILTTGLFTLFAVYLAFIILSSYLKNEV